MSGRYDQLRQRTPMADLKPFVVQHRSPEDWAQHEFPETAMGNYRRERARKKLVAFIASLAFLLVVGFIAYVMGR